MQSKWQVTFASLKECLVSDYFLCADSEAYLLYARGQCVRVMNPGTQNDIELARSQT